MYKMEHKSKEKIFLWDLRSLTKITIINKNKQS